MTESELKPFVERFQCPGCLRGSDTACGSFSTDGMSGKSCASHRLGTFAMPAGTFALGMPKGFSKPGLNDDDKPLATRMKIRLWKSGEAPEWDNLNVPVWALEQEGFLFVRTYCPRINVSYVDVIEGGSALGLCPQAINVGHFYDEID